MRARLPRLGTGLIAPFETEVLFCQDRTGGARIVCGDPGRRGRQDIEEEPCRCVPIALLCKVHDRKQAHLVGPEPGAVRTAEAHGPQAAAVQDPHQAVHGEGETPAAFVSKDGLRGRRAVFPVRPGRKPGADGVEREKFCAVQVIDGVAAAGRGG